jgi:tight adherence protein B
MILFFYGAVFILFFLSLWFLTRGLAQGGNSLWLKNMEWFVTTTDYLFLPLSDAAARRIIASVVVLFALAGFLLPGQLVVLDRYSINRAIELNSYGKYQEAYEILRDYTDSGSPLIHNEIGVSYLGMDSYREAQSHFEKAIRLQPEYVQAHANLAVVYSLQGKELDASFELRKGKSLSKYTLDEEQLFGLEGGIFSGIYTRIFTMLFFALIGWYLPRMILKWLKARRMRQFDELLPEGLIMATNGLRAGMSLGQVLETLSREAPKPLNQEFGLVVKEQRLGKEFDETLRGLVKRIPTDDTAILVNSIVILREVGGNLTEVFEKLAFTIRERKMIKQKISTMTAEGRSQAVILVLLPLLLGWILNKLSPEVFSLMYTTPLGWFIMIFMMLWGGMGCFFMWKIVQVKI